MTTDLSLVPALREYDGKICANSRDIAAHFEKQHSHVLRDIDNLLKDLPNPKMDGAVFIAGSPGLFIESSYEDANRQTRRCIEMSRDGFSLLAMGFTGAKALAFKLRYIEQFNAMESALRNRAAGYAIPQTLSEALRLAADQADTIEAQKKLIAASAVKVEALGRIAEADGSLCITNAAKDLQVRPKDLFSWLVQHRWIYRRTGSPGYVAYQDKLQAGVLEHKVTAVSRSDGSEKLTEQVRLTPKGLTKLAETLTTEGRA